MTLLRIMMVVVVGIWSSSATLADPDDAEREGGILGTGIVGTITALGSIYVNGQHIVFDPETAVSEGVSVNRAVDLLPGHTVAVIADPADTQWRASYIRQIVPLVGPLQIAEDNQITVMGTKVLAHSLTSFEFRTGDWVAVSGLWQTGQVFATRIDRVGKDIPARIEGTVIGYSQGQPLRIGDTKLAGFLPSHIKEGDVVRGIGSPLPGALRISQLETGVFAGHPEIVYVEGYFSIPTPSGFYTMLGSDIVSYTDNPAMIDPKSRQLACIYNGKLFPITATLPEGDKPASLIARCVSENDM